VSTDIDRLADIAEALFHAIHCGDDKCRQDAEQAYREWVNNHEESR
jgi:hypothetical protein